MKRKITFLVALVAAWVLAANLQAAITFNSKSIRWIGDGSSAKITWKNTAGEWQYYRLIVTESENYGNPDYWKNVYTTSITEQEVAGLAVDRKYYVHIQGGVDAEHIEPDVYSYPFYTKPNSGNCGLYFHMRDSYGDGWDGAKIVIEDSGNKTEITLENGSEGWTQYISNSESAKMYWESGSCDGEISFDIYRGDGSWWIMVKDAGSQLKDGQVVGTGKLCNYQCAIQTSNIDFTSNADKTEYTVSWTPTSVTGAFEVAVVQKVKPNDEELDKAAKVLSASKFIVAGKPNAVQHIYVRGVCSDGERGPWAHKIICNPNTEIQPQDWLPKVAKNIKLPFTDKGVFMANAVGWGTGVNNWTPFLAYHFTLKEKTDVLFAFYSAEQEYSTLYTLYQDPGDGNPFVGMGSFSGGSKTLEPGDYYLTVTNDKGDDYIFRISKESEPTVKDIKSLNFYAEGDFTNEQDYDMGSYIVPAKIFRYKPAKDQEVYMQFTSVNQKGAVQVAVYKNELAASAFQSSGVANCMKTLSLTGGTTYYFVLYTIPGFRASRADNYKFLLAAKSSEPTKAKLINLDTHITDALGKDDFVSEISVVGKLYEFVLNEDMNIAYSFELLGEHANDPNYLDGTELYFYKDDLNGSIVAEWRGQNVIYGSESFTGTPSGTHYYVVILNGYGVNTEYRLDLRAMTPANNIKGKRTIEVNKGYQSGLSVLDPFRGNSEGVGASYVGAYGSVEYYTVHLESGKRYQITSHKLDPDSGDGEDYCAITVLDPSKTGTFASRTAASTKNLHDGWLLLEFTPSATRDYTLVFGSTTHYSNAKDSLPYEFAVNQVKEVQNNMSEVTKVSPDDLPYKNDGIFSGNRENLPSSTYHFMESGTTWIQQYGAYDALPLLVTVHAGDSLYVEFGGDEDVSIYLYAGSATTPIIINDVPYAYPFEKYGLKNTTSADITYYILGAYNNPRVQAAPYYMRLSKSANDFAPEVVTAKANKASVSIYKTDGVAEAQEALGLISLSAVNNAGKQVCTLPNYSYLWKVDLDVNKAYYELNDSDLPMGLTFGKTQTIEVNIKRNKVNIEEVEISSERDGAVRKILREGRILIVTPNGTFDMMGRKVE